MKGLFTGFDWLLFLPILGMAIFGLIVVGSVTPQLFSQQLAFLFFSFLAFFIFSLIDYRIWEKLAVLLFIFSLLFLISPLVFGKLTRGSFRWLQLGPLSLQPSEITKPFLILFWAAFLTAKEKIDFKRTVIATLLLIGPAFLVFLQPDLGSSLVIAFSWLGMILVSGVNWSIILGGSLSFLLLMPLFWRFLKDYQRQRIFSFLKPLEDPLGTGYHLIQAQVAIGSGQFLGRGLGRGTQSQLHFLPERHTDFIFASLAEELGFLGAGFLILIFAFLLWRLLKISQQARDDFGGLICLGVFTLFLSQILINVGMNLGLLPVTGLTLPLVSYGGSSLLTSMICLGLTANVARLKKREEIAIIAS